MKQKLALLANLVLIAAFALSACQPATPAPAPTAAPTAVPTAAPTAAPKILTIALSQEPDLVSLFTSMSFADWVAQLTVTGLAKWDDKNNLIPDLAASIPTADNGGVSKDGLTITWKLKPGLKWSDGQPLTSADVKFTWQVENDKNDAVYTRAGYDQISSIDTPDDTTAILHFSTLYPGWQTLFTSGPNNSGALLPQHLLQGKEQLEKDPYTRCRLRRLGHHRLGGGRPHDAEAQPQLLGRRAQAQPDQHQVHARS